MHRRVIMKKVFSVTLGVIGLALFMNGCGFLLRSTETVGIGLTQIATCPIQYKVPPKNKPIKGKDAIVIGKASGLVREGQERLDAIESALCSCAKEKSNLDVFDDLEDKETIIIVCFSGGGMRAYSLAQHSMSLLEQEYNSLRKRDKELMQSTRSLVEAIDVYSTVSGGSLYAYNIALAFARNQENSRTFFSEEMKDRLGTYHSKQLGSWITVQTFIHGLAPLLWDMFTTSAYGDMVASGIRGNILPFGNILPMGELPANPRFFFNTTCQETGLPLALTQRIIHLPTDPQPFELDLWSAPRTARLDLLAKQRRRPELDEEEAKELKEAIMTDKKEGKQQQEKLLELLNKRGFDKIDFDKSDSALQFMEKFNPILQEYELRTALGVADSTTKEEWEGLSKEEREMSNRTALEEKKFLKKRLRPLRHAHTLEDLGSTPSSFRLENAAAASAAFPGVVNPIPLAKYHATDSTRDMGESSYESKEALHVVDGGVFDNSGMTTAVDFFEYLHDEFAKEKKGKKLILVSINAEVQESDMDCPRETELQRSKLDLLAVGLPLPFAFTIGESLELTHYTNKIRAQQNALNRLEELKKRRKLQKSEKSFHYHYFPITLSQLSEYERFPLTDGGEAGDIFWKLKDIKTDFVLPPEHDKLLAVAASRLVTAKQPNDEKEPVWKVGPNNEEVNYLGKAFALAVLRAELQRSGWDESKVNKKISEIWMRSKD